MERREFLGLSGIGILTMSSVPMSQLLEEEKYKNEIANYLGLDKHIQFILRAGYLNNYPDPVSLRRPVSWFVH